MNRSRDNASFIITNQMKTKETDILKPNNPREYINITKSSKTSVRNRSHCNISKSQILNQVNKSISNLSTRINSNVSISSIANSNNNKINKQDSHHNIRSLSQNSRYVMTKNVSNVQYHSYNESLNSTK